MVRYLNGFLRHMLEFSYIVRYIIVVPTLAFFITLYIFNHYMYYSAIFFIVPIALVSWLFSRKVFFICMGIIGITLLIFDGIASVGIDWSNFFTTSSFVSAILLFIEGLLVGSLREQVLLADKARLHIADLLEQQQQLSQIKDQFMLNVNHELRTPLTAVYGYLELLLEYGAQLDSATQATFLKNALYSCEELQLLVSNVLDTIQVGNEEGSLYLEDLAVVDVIYEVVEHFDPRQQRKYPVQINVPVLLVVRANGQYLRQVLRNLFSNAIKYAPVDSPITIEASLYGDVVQANHPAPEVCISVKDEGLGIAPEDIPRLFGQFVRLKRDLSGNVRGTGLGLYVSKQLVEAMGGRIWVVSTGIAGEGSCFRFTLPCVTKTNVRAKTPLKSPMIPALPISTTEISRL